MCLNAVSVSQILSSVIANFINTNEGKMIKSDTFSLIRFLHSACICIFSSVWSLVKYEIYFSVRFTDSELNNSSAYTSERLLISPGWEARSFGYYIKYQVREPLSHGGGIEIILCIVFIHIIISFILDTPRMALLYVRSLIWIKFTYNVRIKVHHNVLKRLKCPI